MTVFGCTLDTMATESDPLSAFRVQLKRCREELGLSYAEAGKRAGISGQRWRNIETGYEVKSGVRIRANPRRDNLIKMARAVEIPVQHALNLAGEKGLDQAEVRRISNQPRRELNQLLNDLSGEQVEGLLHFVRSMTDPQADAQRSRDYHTEEIEGPVELPDQRDADNGERPVRPSS